MTKPTFASVTDQPCTCNYLSDAANAPDSPIVLDQRTGEYQFQYDERRRTRLQRLAHAVWGDEGPTATLIIYHCPFCGGAAPESKRHLLFEVIPNGEESRLAKLLKDINSVDEAIRRLGPPDFEDYAQSTTPESESCPPKIERHRHIRYYRLSHVANVDITERSDGSAYWHLYGKPKSI